MKAIIFAAGKGERMRPLTDHTPKPLLTIKGKPLIDFHLEKLAHAGFSQVIINLSYKSEMIKQYCGDGSRYGLAIDYSEEGPEPLETGGALNLCLPWFADECFAMVSADIYSDLDYSTLAGDLHALKTSECLATLTLVNNPTHNAKGDFSISKNLLCDKKEHTFTYSGLGVATPKIISLFPDRAARFPLRDALYYWRDKQKISANVFTGNWSGVGNPEKLAELQLGC